MQNTRLFSKLPQELRRWEVTGTSEILMTREQFLQEKYELHRREGLPNKANEGCENLPKANTKGEHPIKWIVSSKPGLLSLASLQVFSSICNSVLAF